MRRYLAAQLLAALVAVTAPVLAQSASYPQKPVRVIVPFPAGGSNDAVCRIVFDKLSDAWKQPAIIENKAGAGGNIGAEVAYRAEPDGYTLLCSPPGPLAINHNLYKSLPYDWAKFAPISVLAVVPNVITVRNTLPVSNFRELIAYAKANPGKLTYASQGNGSTSHLSAEMLASQAGITMLHVPYKGEGPAIADLVAGRVDLFFGNISGVMRFRKTGQVKVLAIATWARDPIAPDVPSAPEIGLADLIASAWFALVAPPGTSGAVVEKINVDVSAALSRADVLAKITELGAEPQGGTSSSTAAFIKAEEARWRGVIKSANVTLE